MSRKRRRTPSWSEEEEDEERAFSYSDDDASSANVTPNNPKEELHPIGHYIDDREEMIEQARFKGDLKYLSATFVRRLASLCQVFSVIKGAKLKAMLTSSLKDLDKRELKALCLEELEGMSKRRIRCILKGER